MIRPTLRENVLRTLSSARPELVIERHDTSLMDQAALHRVWQLGTGSLSPTQFGHLQTLLEILSLKQRDTVYGETLAGVPPHG